MRTNRSITADRPRGFLYLRRFPGERIALFDRQMFGWVEVVDIDVDTDIVRLNLPAEPDVQIGLFDTRPFLQGDGMIRLHSIQEFHDGPPYVSLGLKVPPEVIVKREELIRGMPLEEIQKIDRRAG